MKNAGLLKKYIQKAQSSKFHLWVLNKGISRMVPFNRAHKFKILKVEENSIKISLPYIKNNLNHVRGIHACAIATLSELCTGLMILTKLDPANYRLIMKKIDIEYFYQAKMNVWASYELRDDQVKSMISDLDNGSIEYLAQLKVFDEQGSEICEAKILWQLKAWTDVKTKV